MMTTKDGDSRKDSDLPPPPPCPPSDGGAEPPRAHERSSDTGDPEDREREGRWMTWFTGGLFLCAVVQAVLFGWQLYVMNRQLTEMATTTKANQMAAKAADDAAKIAMDAAKGADEQFKITSELNRESVKLSKAALDASIESSRTDQRAWIGLKYIKIVPMEKGKPLVVEVGIYNFGKTPGRSVASDSMLFFKVGERPEAELIKEWEAGINIKYPPGASVLFPGEVDIYTPMESDDPLTDLQIANINGGKVHLYVIGRVDYFDVFDQPRWTRYLYHYHAKSGKFDLMRGYNEAN